MEDLISATCPGEMPAVEMTDAVSSRGGAGASTDCSAGATAAPEFEEANAGTGAGERAGGTSGVKEEGVVTREDSGGALQTGDDAPAALAEAVRDAEDAGFGAEPPPVGRPLVPLPRSARSSSSGARRAALTSRSKPISR